ncbi:polynucleotide adenylyltransferase PcnB [Ideonella livida]|uniref:Poly(A) polymerase I n=1 Tax=Ideonella livida TaxID=2707176 RepID=A0A7C9TL17_9BURK|nr:polynucleotide adenylyltransferase PcnB [Ideonella livida]NDY91705.1 polynucleotide adenylyltransferase PcnB [Ideonella livida]
MIRKFINKLLGKDAAQTPAPVRIPLGQRVEVPVAEHGINPRLLDDRAVKVVTTLQDAGYEAYIVGGAVRDLLVGRRPKDFDVATNATPEQVKALFRRAFIIGRRFQIVHVIHGRGRDHEVIEVSTFRAYLDPAAAEPVQGNEKTAKSAIAHKQHAVDASGRVLRDNVWGPQIEDAARRDFTVNAMYYDPRTQTVIDYHQGLKDAKGQVLRMIGDPETRYREDPVRILRVVRFAAKLGFTIDARTQQPIRAMSSLLANVPASRLFDEMVKLLQTGHAVASVAQLKVHGLDRGVFPVLDAVLAQAPEGSDRWKFILLALQDTDRRVQEGKAVAPSFLLACLLWHDVLQGWEQRRAQGEPATPALSQAIDAVFDARIGDISGRGKLAADMRDIWMMQPRFERRGGRSPYTLVEQPRFRAGYDFLRLRADAESGLADLAEWWEDFSLGDEGEREALVEAVREQAPRTRRPAREAVRDAAVRPAGEGGDEPEDADADAEAPSADGGEAPARKRRRRRRKPAGARVESTAAGQGGGDTGPAA